MADFRIYIGVLADYNAGRLHGGWIDCDGKDADELQEEVNGFLRSSRYPNVTVMHEGREVPSAEEFAIHDHEGFPANSIEEYTPLSDVAAIVEALEGLEDHQRVGFRFLLWNNHGQDIAEAASKAGDVNWTKGSKAEALQEFYEDTGQMEGIPDWVCIDWDAVARNWEASGELTSFDDPEEGRVQVFGANDL